jgi:hypothetical protein
VPPGGDRERPPAEAEVDRGEGLPELTRVVAAVFRVPEAELSEVVLAPADDGAVVEERAGVVATGRDRARAPPLAEVDRGERLSQLVRFVTAVVPVAEAELSGVVPTPALDHPVRAEGTAVGPAEREGDRLVAAVARAAVAGEGVAVVALLVLAELAVAAGWHGTGSLLRHAAPLAERVLAGHEIGSAGGEHLVRRAEALARLALGAGRDYRRAEPARAVAALGAGAGGAVAQAPSRQMSASVPAGPAQASAPSDGQGPRSLAGPRAARAAGARGRAGGGGAGPARPRR